MAAVVPAQRSALTGPSYQGSGVWNGFSPADLRSAYGLPTNGGSGLTVAITIAYDNPTAETDLATYRSHYELPPCTGASGCFKKVNQLGEPGNYPQGNEEWGLESSLDLDMVSAVCPQCHILLVEANSNEEEDLGHAVEKAAALGADVISNSWAGEEFPEETSEDHHFDHPGIPTLFASGDWGYGVEYPAASPDVVAVGGTSLKKAATARGWSEEAWSGAGSGCSEFEPKPAWQKDEGCPNRTVADVSAVADVETPVSVFDSYYGFPGWQLLGGTSVATPLLAGIEALSSSAFRAAGPSAFWRAGNAEAFNDVIEGEDGPCGFESASGFNAIYLCQSDLGYDGPTGWGTPKGPLSMPVAMTEGATVASSSSAVLHGSVDPGGLPLEYRFEYGETLSYGKSVPVPDASIGAASGYVEVSQPVEGLNGQTPYHYRIRATNSLGTFYGVDRTFGTTPPNATTGSASEIRATRATVHGSVDPRGLKTSYYFEYGISTNYDHKMPVRAGALSAGVGSVGVSAELTSLTGSTQYHYRVVAKNAAGTTYGADELLVTEPPQWIVADMPQPPNSGNGEEAYGVSCLPSEECVAVGGNWSLDVHTRVPLAEHWDGQEWSTMSTPYPEGLDEGWQYGRYAVLRGISCVSASSCIAVGQYKGPSDVVEPLAEQWDGSEWSMIPVPKPAGAMGALLKDVSCVSASQCMAVGRSEDASSVREALIEAWDGSQWVIQPAPKPAAASQTWLSGVSCASQASCVAAGGAVEEPYNNTFAAHWDGSEWSVQETPHPGREDILEDVSCSSSSACTAVGYYLPASTPDVVSLVQRWNGMSWTIQSSPTPYGAGWLNSVSCASATSCTAAGTAYNSSHFDHGSRSLIERWNGASWSTLETAVLSAPAGWWHEDALWGISCAQAQACDAVGERLAAPEGSLASSESFSQHEVTPPFAHFSWMPGSPLTGEAVTFDASATTDPGHTVTSYQWSFGDGASATGASPSHVYAHAGNYVATLTVGDDAGNSRAVSHVVTIAGRPPTAAFAVDTANPSTTQPVGFDGSGSSDPDGTIAAYKWDFGDGVEGSGSHPTHSYARAGSYEVTLVVQDNEGETASATKTVDISDAPPSASFSVAASATAGHAVAFDGAASADPDGGIVHYKWDFGDGAGGEGVAVQHTYARSGSYQVTLTVVDDGGLSTSTQRSVSVAAPSNEFALLSVTHHKRSGAATLTIEVPGPGEVQARGTGDDPPSGGPGKGLIEPAGVRADQAGTVKLKLVPTAASRRRLRRRRTLAVNVLISFTPDFGTADESLRAIILHMPPKRQR
jgi:PKD repeat protein